MATRNIDLGPDGRLNWDKMSNAGVYLGHMENQLTGTSNAGAVTHATGVKVFNESFGLNEDQSIITPGSGKVGYTILEEAIAAGKATALIQSGHIGEPGTAAFAAATTNRVGNTIRARDKTAEIAEQVIRSGTQIIMAGGEVYLLPKGTTGFHVTAQIDAAFSDSEDRPTTNLIDLAKSLGYTVVYTEAQMNTAVASATAATKLLGVFAANHTFDDRTEEALGLNSANPLPLYIATAPTVAEMLDASLKILSQDPDGFFVVIEEEGSDNFANNNNAVGTIEAVRRADAAIGVAMNYINTQDPNTLVITAADSDAGGLQVFQFEPYTRPSGNSTSSPTLADTEPSAPFIGVNPTTTNTNRAVLDGINGSTGTAEAPWKPFAAKSSIDGPMGNFGVAWVGTPDFPGSIVAKAHGMNADKLPSTLDNTEIYNVMYQTMFGVTPEFAASQQATQLVSGTTGVDILIAGAANTTFDGINDTVFTGAGDDEIEAQTVSSPIAGRNRIDSGSGNDIIFAGNNDVVFGSSGNDHLYASDVSGYRLSGGAGDDTFYLGSNGRALGGDGIDIFRVSLGGGNLISGGAGADEFWIVNAELPKAANTVLDFQKGTDVIGVLGISSSSLTLNVLNGNTEIGLLGQTVAIVNGVTGLDINTNFVFR
jgi:glycerophosphoryl diester phosphodiesterase